MLPSAFVPPPSGSLLSGIPQLWHAGPFGLNIFPPPSVLLRARARRGQHENRIRALRLVMRGSAAREASALKPRCAVRRDLNAFAPHTRIRAGGQHGAVAVDGDFH